MPLVFQYVPMNAVGVLGTADVLKTGGVGTCIVLVIEYSASDIRKYALSHVPYDSDALLLKGEQGVFDYISAVYQLLGNPPKDTAKVTVIQNLFGLSGVNKLVDYIKSGLERFGLNDVVFESYETSKRMSVAVLKTASGTYGRYICYASNKIEFIDECEFAEGAKIRGSNIIADLDPKKRSEKPNFRRHADLYAQARSNIMPYSQSNNPYMLALVSGTTSAPFLAETALFSRPKTTHWTKKDASPPVFTTYIEWENTIRGKILTKK